ncbi:MAG: Na(+)/H(+) antiporter subunit B [Alphaproteobacteria bacterium]
MNQHAVLRVVTKLLMPCILLFALYVQFHGELGPGGGFQAGVIFGVGFVLYALIFGVRAARLVAPSGVLRTVLAGGVLLYAGVGVAGILRGGSFLNYAVLRHDPVHGQEMGIQLIEFGVGSTVAAAIISLFLIFAGQEQR